MKQLSLLILALSLNIAGAVSYVNSGLVVHSDFPGSYVISSGTNIDAGTLNSNTLDSDSIAALTHPNFEDVLHTPNLITNLSIGTTTTGSAGSSASVENTGTASFPILEFTVPQGMKGDTGATGSTGFTGAQGVKGDTGSQGIQGTTGATGSTGSAGAQGNPGTNAAPSSTVFTNLALNSIFQNAASYSIALSSCFTVTPALLTGNAYQLLMVGSSSTGPFFRASGQGQSSIALLLVPPVPCSWEQIIPAGSYFYITNVITAGTIGPSTNSITFIP